MSSCAGRLGCFAVIVLLVAAAWWYRGPAARAVRGWIGGPPAPLPSTARSDVGAPTEAALASAEAKAVALSRADGPDSVILTANETASLIGAGLDWAVRRAFDSLRVELRDGRIVVHARFETARIPDDALGPLAGVLDAREPVRLGGTIEIEEPGRARLFVDEFRIRTFEFPEVAIARLLRRVARADPDGSFPIAVAHEVGAVRLRADGVTLVRARVEP